MTAFVDGHILDALNLFSEMMNKGIDPNVVTHTCLIHGFFRLGQWNEVKKLIDEMVGTDIYTQMLIHILFWLILFVRRV